MIVINKLNKNLIKLFKLTKNYCCICDEEHENSSSCRRVKTTKHQLKSGTETKGKGF